ncbi:MAG: hypothetical protein OZSIB_0151 [Candidatus Ozemobacter sibiricus]|jgi:hypothetical protein|uniref:Uncharacterized protein n=1 Tax=Candidatus Ozemobacter sibiricus TaxID=2268124 RepID=A0A367ZMK9_9BACT|nr:MAG: hypothetical protein OZSIB_0151 [Candidatus Ozemobacter sibiricus]
MILRPCQPRCRAPASHRRRAAGRRRGMAIVIALFFAFCLMILVAGMLFQHKNVAQHNRMSLEQQQAFFAARAAIQHFLLKAKLFPTELYDAVEFSVGKNPLCDFSEFSGSENFQLVKGFSGVYVRKLPAEELDVNRKPKYFYIKLAGQDDVFIKMGSFYNPDYRYLGPGLAQADPKKKYTQPINPQVAYGDVKADKFLRYFIRDCTNARVDGKRLQPALEMLIGPGVNTATSWKIATSEGYPYTMTYKVNRVSLQAMKELRRYNEEAIEIEVEGTIYDFKYDALKPDRGGKFSQVQRKVQKITRRGSL